MEITRDALLSGDLDTVKQTFSTGRVILSQPLSKFPEQYYPIHCATISGSIALIR